MILKDSSIGLSRLLLSGFLAGFLATLIFHQLVLAFLWGIGVAPFRPFILAPTPPFGVPVVLSLAFWGGIWGIFLALIQDRFPRSGYWLILFLFGAIIPSLVALIIVLPLKGRPMGGGWHPALLATAFVINGAWAMGTGFFLKVLKINPNFPKNRR
jgi:hypothetical protein